MLLCEPQFDNEVHSALNAALLCSVDRAFPGLPFFFMGRIGHLRAVREALSTHSSTPIGAAFVRFPVAPRNLGSHGRFRQIQSLFQIYVSVVRYAKKNHSTTVLFTSISKPGILILRTLLPLLARRIRVLAIVHQLSDLHGEARRSLKSLHRLLRLLPRDRLQFMALGQPVFDALAKSFPELVSRFSPLEPPYLWQKREVTRPRFWKRERPPLTFAHFGRARAEKMRTFLAVANRYASDSRLRFKIAGSTEPRLVKECELAGIGQVVPHRVTHREMLEAADGVNYAIWSVDPDRYRLRASASFLDLLSFLKPALYARTPWSDYYVPRMGKIGWLCQDTSSMVAKIEDLLSGASEAEYRQQQETILAARERFSPRQVSPQLAEILSRK